MQERAFDVGKRFEGEVTMAGKDKGKDCSVGTQDLTGKVRPLNTSPSCPTYLAIIYRRACGSLPTQ